MTWLLVAAGGAAGAVLRYLASRAYDADGSRPPWGTLLVNVAGSALLGVLTGAGGGLPRWLPALVGVGFCGALTTYSTFAHDTVRLAARGAWRLAALNVAATLAGGIGGAAAGWSLAGP